MDWEAGREKRIHMDGCFGSKWSILPLHKSSYVFSVINPAGYLLYKLTQNQRSWVKCSEFHATEIYASGLGISGTVFFV
jgi:hypothetical protein